MIDKNQETRVWRCSQCGHEVKSEGGRLRVVRAGSITCERPLRASTDARKLLEGKQ